MVLTTIDDLEAIQEARKLNVDDYLLSTRYSLESVEKKVGEILGK
jgi:hypothetical protein